MATICVPRLSTAVSVIAVLAICWLLYLQLRYAAIAEAEYFVVDKSGVFFANKSPQEDHHHRSSVLINHDHRTSNILIKDPAENYASPVPQSRNQRPTLFFVSTTSLRPTQMPLLMRTAQALLFLGGDRGIYWILVETSSQKRERKNLESQQQEHNTTKTKTQACSPQVRNLLVKYMAQNNFPFAHICSVVATKTAAGGTHDAVVATIALQLIQDLLGHQEGGNRDNNAYVFFGQVSHLADARFLNEMRLHGGISACQQKVQSSNEKVPSFCRKPTLLSLLSVTPGKVLDIQGELWSRPPLKDAKIIKKMLGKSAAITQTEGQQQGSNNRQNKGMRVLRGDKNSFNQRWNRNG